MRVTRIGLADADGKARALAQQFLAAHQTMAERYQAGFKAFEAAGPGVHRSGRVNPERQKDGPARGSRHRAARPVGGGSDYHPDPGGAPGGAGHRFALDCRSKRGSEDAA